MKTLCLLTFALLAACDPSSQANPFDNIVPEFAAPRAETGVVPDEGVTATPVVETGGAGGLPSAIAADGAPARQVEAGAGGAGDAPSPVVDGGRGDGAPPEGGGAVCPYSAAGCPDCGIVYGPGCCAGDRCGCSPVPQSTGLNLGCL